MFGRLGSTELLVILAIVMVVFGPKQLPKLGSIFGKSLKNFKEGVAGNDNNTAE